MREKRCFAATILAKTVPSDLDYHSYSVIKRTSDGSVGNTSSSFSIFAKINSRDVEGDATFSSNIGLLAERL